MIAAMIGATGRGDVCGFSMGSQWFCSCFVHSWSVEEGPLVCLGRPPHSTS